MNEKYLLELWEKSKHPHPKYGGQDMIWPAEFAELIIRECIGVINNDIKYNQLILHNDNSYKIHNMASLTGVIGKIKQHFGVEL